MVIASLALIIALGGTSYAAVTITGANVRNNSLTGIDVKSSSLTGSDVKNGSLTAKDLKAGVIPNRTRFVLINGAGQIERQSGGFTVTAGYPTGLAAPGDPNRANGNVYINAGEDLTDNGIVATIALQNAVDQNNDGVMGGRAPGADSNPEFSGEISASQCMLSVVTCAPPGTNTNTHFVVSPRNSDGTVTSPNARKRFYVQITG